jgi:signal transduction histidine kinase
MITVQDTGIGIAPHNLERIFEPFWQVEQGRARSNEGTGLGLNVARRLARLMDGDIQVTSRQGEGTRFVLLLPWVRPPAAAA